MCVLLSLDGGDQSSSGPYLFGLFLVRIQAFHLITAVQCLPLVGPTILFCDPRHPYTSQDLGLHPISTIVFFSPKFILHVIYFPYILHAIYLLYLATLILRSKLTNICWISLIVFQQHTNEQLHDSLSLVLLSSRLFNRHKLIGNRRLFRTEANT